ncbi:MAG: ABC transporter permease subunit [Spirochaetes bacterium]|jgi:multiple sugar transport system permease protein|nr:ABC transporter permease subunit [Spirochaetota bacterium]
MVRRFENRTAYLFLSPFLLVYGVFMLYPIFQAAFMSVFEWDLLSLQRDYIGLSNFTEMFTKDARFWSSLSNTVEFVLLSSPLIIIFGLFFALGVAKPKTGAMRTMLFSPYVLSVAVMTLIWGFLFNPDQGLIAEALRLFSLEPLAWLTNPSLAMHAIVIATLWWTVGFNMVLFVAGLQDIDPSLYEAARIDGAGPVSRFFHITIPGLERTIALVAILQIIASFQIFGQVYIMTRGGPGGTTRVLIQYIYESGFRDFRLGYASAMSIILFVVMFLVSIVQLRLSQRREA